MYELDEMYKKEFVVLSDEKRYFINWIQYLIPTSVIRIDFTEDVDVSLLEASLFDKITLYTMGSSKCGEFIGYNTIYDINIDEHKIFVSNDGSTKPIGVVDDKNMNEGGIVVNE